MYVGSYVGMCVLIQVPTCVCMLICLPYCEKKQARKAGKEQKKWLLVNIQKDSEFDSHLLNRETWKDELVEEFVASGFIFWQVHTYIHTYKHTFSEQVVFCTCCDMLSFLVAFL